MKVLIYPKYVNPYQELLYSKLRAKYPSSTFSYLSDSRLKFMFYPLVFLIKRLRGYRIIHIHWLVFNTRLPIPFAKFLSYYYTVFCLKTLRFLGFKIVWTVHDITPHDEQTINDMKISVMLSRLADVKIVHTGATISQMKEADMDSNNTVIIPHGNYNDVYPDTISRSQARAKLHIRSSEFVILFFGSIKPYKGIDGMLEAVAKLNQPRVRLVIAGKCTDPGLFRRIHQAQKSITFDFYDGYVPDEEVAMYFKACDIVCLPFKEITTSGSALLALSFGKPLVAPRIGALTDLPSSVGFLYDPLKTDALFNSLIEATSGKKLERTSESARRYSQTLSWDKIAEKTYEAYEAVENL